MSRNRFLAVFATPFVILSLVPVVRIAALGPSAPPMVLWYLALVNGVLCSGDVVGFILILSQIPSRAVVRNHGWKTYWKQ